MNFPPFNDPWGKNRAASERPPVKAPADLNWDAIEAKIRQRKQPASTGEPRYDSSGYLGRMREEDPWPAKDEKNSDSVSLVNCRFLNPEDLVPDQVCTVACDVKILQTPSSREVLFRLQSRLADSDPWKDSNETSTAALKTDLPSQTVQAKLTLYCPMPAPELGTMLHFRVIAEHTEAAADAESQDTPVQLRNLCHYVGAPEIVFPNDGECPTLDEAGGLVQALAAVVKQLSLPQPMGSDTVVVFGFASSSGSDSHNRDLSLRRAQVLKSLLGLDANSWGDLAKANFTTIDIQQILSGLNHAFDWPCDPGEVDGEDGPKTQGAVKAFQAECNSRYSLGLKPDGVCGPKTWKAVHRAICAEVAKALGQDPSAEPSWPEIPWGYSGGQGVYACGEDFASSDDGAADKHAEICVFGSNMEPPLTAPAPGEKVTIAEDPVEDPEKIKKVRLETSAKDDGSFVQYEPTISRIRGKVVSKNFVVECDDGAQMCVETDETRWILQLADPISLQAKEDDPDHFPAEDGVEEIQINIDESASADFQEGEKVFLEGYLSHGHSQFHHTEIQMALRGRIGPSTSKSDA